MTCCCIQALTDWFRLRSCFEYSGFILDSTTELPLTDLDSDDVDVVLVGLGELLMTNEEITGAVLSAGVRATYKVK